MKYEEKFAALASCGITLGPGYTAQHLLDRTDGDRERLDEDDLLMFIYLLGMNEWDDREYDVTTGSLSPQVHTFDTECVYGPGSYTLVVHQIAAMTQGALAISDIEDQIEDGQAGAQLGFTCNGQRVALRFDQDDDWFNPFAFECLGALLNATGSPLRLFQMDSGDQCAMTGCLLPDQIAKLNALGVATSIYDQTLPLAGCTVTAA